MSSNVPAKIGKYDVIDVIGHGGMGIVYKATDPHLGRLVAIKMITAGFAENPDLLKRFFREAQSLGGLQHPNIVTVYDLGDYGGVPYLVMQFLEGEGLDSALLNRRPLSLLEKINITIQVCQGLSYAHHRGVVHRDIKPANIMLEKDGGVKIFDFGIARIGDPNVTTTGQIVGTLSYMSPEQVNAQPVDARTDIFSAGVVLYQLFTNHLPFEGESTATTLLKILHDPPPPLRNFTSTYPAELENILLRALAKNPDERYSSADEFALDLIQLQGQLKQELIAEEMQQAALLLDQGNIYKAQESLLRVLKFDPHQTDATRLAREVQQKIKKEEIAGRVRALRAQVEEALSHDQIESARETLERAIGLDRENAELQQLGERIRTAILRTEKLHNVLKLAQSAHAEGKLDAAKQAAEEALELAPNDAQAKSVYRRIHRAWLEHTRQRQLETFVFEARQEIASRRFTAALDLLKQAETLDPEAPEVRTLIESAVSGREQERRRKELEAVTREVEDALNRDDYRGACVKADEGLVRFPSEPRLVKLRALADRQRQIEERQQFIDEQITVARKLLQENRNEEVLKALEGALAKVGTEPRLQSLLTMARENLEREQLKQRRRAEALEKARTSLQNQQQEDAIRVLEEIESELPEDAEIHNLLERARAEQQATVQSAISRAKQQSILDLRVQILEEALRKNPAEANLQQQLHGVHDLEKLVSSIANEARALEQAQQYDHALVKWEALRSAYRHYPDLDHIIENVQRLREQAHTEARSNWIERARSALQSSDNAQASALVDQAIEEFPWDADLMEIKEKAEAGLRLRTKAEKILAEAQAFFAKQQWERGADTVVRACQIVSQDAIVRDEAANRLLQASKTALEKNWRAAEIILHRLQVIQPDFEVPPDLTSSIAGLKREELVGSSYAAAKRLLAAGDLQGALSEVVRGLTSYPDDPRLKELRAALEELIKQAQERELLERARQQKEAFIGEAISRAQREPVLDLRTQILEEALKREPQEARLQQQLRSVQDLGKRVSSIVNDARSLEQAGKYDHALAKWEDLRAAHRNYPDLDQIVEETKRRQLQARSEARANWIRMIESGLMAADHEQATDLLGQAKRDFPSDRELAEIENRVREGVERRAKAEKILAGAAKAISKEMWKTAAESFELARQTANPDPLIRDRVLHGLLQAAEAALNSDSQSAEMFFDQAMLVQPESPLLALVKTKIESNKREELIELCLSAALRYQRASDFQGALRALEPGLSAFPNEPRLLERREQIESQIRTRKEEGRRLRESELRREADVAARALELQAPASTPSSQPALPSNLGTSEIAATAPVAASRPERADTATLSAPQGSDTLQNVSLPTIERELARFIGPLAKVTVKRAASKAKNSDELYAILAASLEKDADRRAFLSGKPQTTAIKANSQTPAEPPKLVAIAASANSSSLLTPAAIEHAASILAPHVGPISALLARKAAQRADSARSLYLLLAEHVEPGTKRARFLRDAGFPDG